MNDKKGNFFVRIGSRLARFFREMRSELKKVVWPTRKQLVNNTLIVLGMMILVSVVIGGYDYIMKLLVIDGLIGFFS